MGPHISLSSFAFLVATVRLILGAAQSPGSLPKPFEAPISSSFCSEGKAYDRDTNFCYDVATNGPCGSRAIFVPLVDNPAFGDCECDKFHVRPLSYWPDFRLCFELYTQGPCHEGEWLVPVRNLTSDCVPNPCRHLENSNLATPKAPEQAFIFTYQGQCYSTETQAFCQQDKVARFINGQNVPSCVDPLPTLASLGGTGYSLSVTSDVGCPPGQTTDSAGKCGTVADFT